MGGGGSKPPPKVENIVSKNVIDDTSNGVHLFELHMPSVGKSLLIVCIVVALVLLGMWLKDRKTREHMVPVRMKDMYLSFRGRPKQNSERTVPIPDDTLSGV